jgi:hypothetical protein
MMLVIGKIGYINLSLVFCTVNSSLLNIEGTMAEERSQGI